MPIRLLRLPVFAFLIFLVGCHTMKQTDRDSTPPDFYMSFGEGGGFTGRWSGYVIEVDGTVYSWSGLTDKAGRVRLGQLDAKERADLWAKVEEAGFFESDLKETGNVTAYLEITAAGRTRRQTWIPGIENIDPPTHPVEKLYVFGQELARRVRVRAK